MRRSSTTIALAGLAALASAMFPSARASACGCDEPGPPSVAIARADAVVLATIKSVQRWSSRQRFEITIEVERVFKGNVAKTAVVLFREAGPCRLTLEAGRRQVLYLQRAGQEYWIPDCWRDADAGDLAALEELASATDAKASRPEAPAPREQAAAAPGAAEPAEKPTDGLPRTRAAGCAGCAMARSERSPAVSMMMLALGLALRRRRAR